MSDLRLLPIDAAMKATLEHGAPAFEMTYGARLRDVTLGLDVVTQTLAMPEAGAWSGYLAADGREIIGTCAYKGAPSDAGEVEIAYFTFRPNESKGYATHMARALAERAFDDLAVVRVIAHTLAETNASTRVLEKVGFRFDGEIVDPDDGPIWRWSLARPG